MKRKYGIWILPSMKAHTQLQSLINQIARSNGLTTFIPHVSVAGLLIEDDDLNRVKNELDQLAERLTNFSIALNQYGMKDEKHRCIYLLAESIILEDLFNKTTEAFPDATIDRNRNMPHLSIMYGEYSIDIKQEIIAKYPNPNITFEVDSLDLCLSDGPEEEWRSVHNSKFYEK